MVENEPSPQEGLERPLRKVPNTPILGLFPMLSGKGVRVIGQQRKKKNNKQTTTTKELGKEILEFLITK